jgi:hypothetical protein
MRFSILFLLALTAPALRAQSVKLIPNEAGKRIDVLIDNQPFTSYIYPGPAVLKKAVLYPIRSAGGQFVTRGWPMDPRPGERVDHPHHVGLWLNYGDVNGHDFWNNSTEVKDQPEKGISYGTVVHTGIVAMKSGPDAGELTVTADWLDPANQPLLRERTTYTFRGTGNGPTGSRTIDRQTTLTAVAAEVVFKDNKEGMIGLRLARELEHPATKAETFTDAGGKPTAVPVLNNAGVSGRYQSSEGETGEGVWGKRGRWMNLTGTLANAGTSEAVTLTLLDHPQNVGYPTYWHARGYGLFAANPLAPSVFDKQAPAMNYTMKAGQSITFRHRLVITSATLTPAQTNALATGFAEVR